MRTLRTQHPTRNRIEFAVYFAIDAVAVTVLASRTNRKRTIEEWVPTVVDRYSLEIICIISLDRPWKATFTIPPTARFLGDGIRVLSRSLQRIAAECKNGALEVVDHGRAVKHRLLEVSRAAKCLTEANQQRMRDSYQKLVGLTRGVVRQGRTAE